MIEQLFVERGKKFANEAELRTFVENMAQKINESITKKGGLIRTHDSDKYPYTRAEKLADQMDSFYKDFFLKLNDGTNPRELAAWVEYRIDLTDHFFSDGCGKTAKAISAWVLMRGRQELPVFRDRKELYANAPTQVRGENPQTDQEQYKKWLAYYKTLFDLSVKN